MEDEQKNVCVTCGSPIKLPENGEEQASEEQKQEGEEQSE